MEAQHAAQTPARDPDAAGKGPRHRAQVEGSKRERANWTCPGITESLVSFLPKDALRSLPSRATSESPDGRGALLRIPTGLYFPRGGGMRRTVIVAFLLGFASVAQAQFLWVGAGTGTSWEWKAQTAPDSNFLHASDQAPTGFVAFPIEDDTLVRLRVADMQHDLRLTTGDVEARIRSYTVGVDYLIDDSIGDATLSAGFGEYQLRPKGDQHDDLNEDKFGWYLGAGEWFTLSRRTRITADLNYHKTYNTGNPQFFTLTVGLALSF
jgi:hypothetical protein